MINELIDIMLDEGMRVRDRYDTYESIADAVVDGNIKAIMRYGLPIGFFSWIEKKKDGKLFIFINNMLIKRKFRNKTNLLFLRKFFRYKYPDMDIAYWWNDRRDRFTYAR